MLRPVRCWFLAAARWLTRLGRKFSTGHCQWCLQGVVTLQLRGVLMRSGLSLQAKPQLADFVSLLAVGLP